ncbi:uncharacterized protein DUF3247 [Luteibacter rhizovicinus]|uniref:Uncharacterized protein DUF3247 n=1 Tax=Luteibacter rhizovicinus TaxID=242606 RepID=A0A4R3YHF3_9GAMM|nr:DUF3247 family protein [Luteibacter rhizovicinus]TCV92035.1 uncharacterized protein DUF3247 [Luteibacter rhizovicinus]
MGRSAEKVYTDHGAIARLEGWIADLADNAKVAIVEKDGTKTTGIVTVLPTIQSFLDGEGNEGMNGVVKLFDPDRPDWVATIWLDHIERIEHLDSVARGTSQT